DLIVTGVQTCALPISARRALRYPSMPTLHWGRVAFMSRMPGVPSDRAWPEAASAAASDPPLPTVHRRDPCLRATPDRRPGIGRKIGRASCRERVWVVE